MTRIDREGPIHRACIAYLRHVLPADAIVHHSANEGVRGGRRGVLDGQRRKAMGQQAGFPDILIFTGGRGYCLEVKAEGGTLSGSQRQVRDILRGQGIPYEVVRSIEDVRETLVAWGVETAEVLP